MYDAQPEWQKLYRAEALIEIERWREAIHELHRFLPSAPDNYRAQCLLGQCYYQLEEHAQAIEWAEKAAAINPTDEWAFRLQACIHRRQGKRKQALKAAEEAVRLEPNEPFALHILACTQIDSNLISDAEKTALHLRETAPESRYGHSALGHIAMNRKQWIEAEAHFRRVLQLEPNSWDAMNNLGWVLFKQSQKGFQFSWRNKQREEAIHCFETAIKLDPTEELAKINLRAARNGNFLFGSNNGSGVFNWWLIIPFLIILQIVVPLALALIDQVIQVFSPVHPNPFVFTINLYFLIVVFGFITFKIMKRFDISLAEKVQNVYNNVSDEKQMTLQIIFFTIPTVLAAVLLLLESRISAHPFTPLAWVAFVFFGIMTLRIFKKIFPKETE